MKKVIILIIASTILSCTPSYQVMPDKEISDDIWNNISKDNAIVYGKVDAINRDLEMLRPKSNYKIDSWSYPTDKTMSVEIASKKKVYQIIKIGSAKIPTVKGGIVDSKIFKIRNKSGIAWFATEKEPKFTDSIVGSLSYLTILENKNIPLYAYGQLNDDVKAIPAIKQLVVFDVFIEKSLDEVNKLIKWVKEKNENSPIYMEGFQVHTGINLSVDLMFKFRE